MKMENGLMQTGYFGEKNSNNLTMTFGPEPQSGNKGFEIILPSNEITQTESRIISEDPSEKKREMITENDPKENILEQDAINLARTIKEDSDDGVGMHTLITRLMSINKKNPSMILDIASENLGTTTMGKEECTKINNFLTYIDNTRGSISRIIR